MSEPQLMSAVAAVMARACGEGPEPPNARITPEPCRLMRRAAAREVRNIVRTAVTTVPPLKRHMPAMCR